MPEDVSTLYRQYSPVLYGFILQFTTNESLACRILEESISSILDRRMEINTATTSPIVFMKRITRDKAIDILKENQQERNDNSREPYAKFLQIANLLSPLHKEVFYRRYYNGADEKEIASALEISEAEVKQKIRETVRTFRDHL